MVARNTKVKPGRVVGVVQRSPRVEVRFQICHFDGRLIFDVRKYLALPGGAPTPTTKGVAFPVEELPALRDAVLAAIEEMGK